MTDVKTKNQDFQDWQYVARVNLGDFLTLVDLEETYLQNYLDQGFTEIKFEPLVKKTYKVFLRRPTALRKYKKIPLNNPVVRALFQVETLPTRIKLLKAQIRNFPTKKPEIKNEINFWQIALANYRRFLKSPAKNKVLADWEVGLPAFLRVQLRNRRYLPSFKEVSKIPFKQREAYQEEFFDYEIWNREYLDVLVKQLKKNQIILEVGAGSGRLSYFLQKRLPKSQVLATDISLKNKVGKIPLIKLSMKQALQKFQPEVLLCAWPDTFFWQEIKANQSARQIILIGDAEDTPLGKDVVGQWHWLPIKGFKPKEFLATKKVQTSRDSLGTTLIYSKIK